MFYSSVDEYSVRLIMQHRVIPRQILTDKGQSFHDFDQRSLFSLNVKLA